MLLFLLFLIHSYPRFSSVSANSVNDTFWQTIDRKCPSIPRILRTQIHIGQGIGAGAWGTVHYARYRTSDTTEELAIKEVTLQDEYKAVLIAKEACSMWLLRDSEHVARLTGVSIDKNQDEMRASILMELYDADLLRVAEDIRRQPWRSPYAASIYKNRLPGRGQPVFRAFTSDEVSARWTSWLRHTLHQVALAVQDVHTAHVAHLDIKPENILTKYPVREAVDEDLLVPKIALTDFGLARPQNVILRVWNKIRRRKTQRIGTLDYLAPEMFMPLKHELIKQWGSINSTLERYFLGSEEEATEVEMFIFRQGKAPLPSKAADIYSLGVSFYEIAVGRLPFIQPVAWKSPHGYLFEVEPGSIISRVFYTQTKKTPSCHSIGKQLCALIKAMIQPDPRSRPTIKQVLNDDFFERIHS